MSNTQGDLKRGAKLSARPSRIPPRFFKIPARPSNILPCNASSLKGPKILWGKAQSWARQARTTGKSAGQGDRTGNRSVRAGPGPTNPARPAAQARCTRKSDMCICPTSIWHAKTDRRFVQPPGHRLACTNRPGDLCKPGPARPGQTPQEVAR